MHLTFFFGIDYFRVMGKPFLQSPPPPSPRKQSQGDDPCKNCTIYDLLHNLLCMRKNCIKSEIERFRFFGLKFRQDMNEDEILTKLKNSKCLKFLKF